MSSENVIRDADAARYRFLRAYPEAVRMLVLHFGFGYCHTPASEMNGGAYLDETLDEVVETGRDAWGREISEAIAASTKEETS